MSHFFTTFFRQQLFANQALMNTANVRLVFFRQAPSLAGNTSTWVTARTKAELTAMGGWTEVSGISGYPLTLSQPVSVRTGVAGKLGNSFVLFTRYPFTGIAPVGIAAIGVELVTANLNGVANPLIFVTNTPVGTVNMNVYPKDALTAIPDSGFPDATNQYLFSWATPPGGAITVDPVEGPLALEKGAPDFEPSNTLHMWLYPQRVNMIANPNFEVDAAYWAPVPTRVSLAAAEQQALKSAWAGQFSGSAPLAVESNIWETRLGTEDHELWTFQAMAKGNGKVKVGLVFWDADYRATGADWGTETWQLQGNTWAHLAGVRLGPQAHTAMLRIECDGTSLTLDKVLAERGALKEWPYFDGHEKYGAPDDYSWYGGSTLAGKSYSMWYSNRRAVMGRMFATPVVDGSPGDVITDTEVMQAGMVYNWVPAGVAVIPHIDVLYPDDLRSAPPARSTTVTPYFTPGAPTGVPFPWAPTVLNMPGGTTGGHYMAAQHTASMAVTGDMCLMMHAKIDWTRTESLLCKWVSTSNRSWFLLHDPNLTFNWSPDGSTQLSAAATVQPSPGTEWIAVTLDVNNGASGRSVKFWTSLDGITWTQLGATVTTAGVTSVSVQNVVSFEVGSFSSGAAYGNFLQARVSDVRLYNGIGDHSAPGLGTLCAHFNGDVPVSPYRDEFGNVWALSGSVAYVPA